jgi:hypothetical protein
MSPLWGICLAKNKLQSAVWWSMLDPETSWHGELVLRVSLLYRFRLHQTQAQLRVDSEHQQIGAQQNCTLGASERVSQDDVWNVHLP